MGNYIGKQAKEKEVQKKKLTQRIVCVVNGDLLKEDFEVIVNSVGVPISKGFGGFIANNILKMTRDKIVQEAVNKANRIFNSEEFDVGEFVLTSAGMWRKIKYIVHCSCRHYEEKF